MHGDTWTVYRGLLRDQRRAIAGWSLGAGIIAIFYLSFYPLVGGDQMNEMLSLMPQGMSEAFGMQDISSAAGYADTTVYSLLGMVIILIFAVTSGARFIGGEEEHGVLELEYTAPIARRQIYWGRLAALWTQLAIAVIAVSVAVSFINAVASLDIDYGNTWLTGIGLWLLTGAFGTISYAVGAALGRRGPALGVSVSLAVLFYLLNAVGPMADLDWMSSISPFDWYAGNRPLVNGLDWGGMLWLALLALVPAVLGWLGMRRRDLMVG